MTSLRTFIKEDEEIQLKIKKSFRSWLVVISGQTLVFFILLYLMKYFMTQHTEIILALFSVVYVGICSWILARKMDDKRFITNKKIILLSKKSRQPIKFIYLSQIKSMHLSYNILGGHIITIITRNNSTYHMEDVSHNRDYISYIQELITNNNTLANQPQSTHTHRIPTNNTKGFVHDKLPTPEDIHLTNLKNQANDQQLSNTIQKILSTPPPPPPTKKVA